MHGAETLIAAEKALRKAIKKGYADKSSTIYLLDDTTEALDTSGRPTELHLQKKQGERVEMMLKLQYMDPDNHRNRIDGGIFRHRCTSVNTL